MLNHFPPVPCGDAGTSVCIQDASGGAQGHRAQAAASSVGKRRFAASGILNDRAGPGPGAVPSSLARALLCPPFPGGWGKAHGPVSFSAGRVGRQPQLTHPERGSILTNSRTCRRLVACVEAVGLRVAVGDHGDRRQSYTRRALVTRLLTQEQPSSPSKTAAGARRCGLGRGATIHL